MDATQKEGTVLVLNETEEEKGGGKINVVPQRYFVKKFRGEIFCLMFLKGRVFCKKFRW